MVQDNRFYLSNFVCEINVFGIVVAICDLAHEVEGKRMIKRKWKVCSHFLPWFLVAANTYWTMNRDG